MQYFCTVFSLTILSKRTMRKAFYSLFILSFLAASCITVTEGEVGGGDEGIKLKSASDFNVSDLQGNPVNLTELSAQKPIIINFWATWCGPCIQEMPHFMEVAKATEDVSFYFVSDESIDKIKKFTGKNEYSETRFLKLKNSFSEVSIKGVPYTFFINKSGKVAATHRGSLEKAELEKLIQDNMTK